MDQKYKKLENFKGIAHTALLQAIITKRSSRM